MIGITWTTWILLLIFSFLFGREIERKKAEKEKKALKQSFEIELVKKKEELEERERRIFREKEILIEREKSVEEKKRELEKKENEILQLQKELEEKKKREIQILEQKANLTKEEAKKMILDLVEKEYQKDILEKIGKLKKISFDEFEKRAKEILVSAIERQAVWQAQEATTTVLTLPSEEIKGRIIGKEGRNIRTFERVTGTTLILDETPETVIISCFNPTRREIAKRALEILVKDGRIQPARIEQVVEQVQKEIENEIREIGEKVVGELNLIDLPEELIKILGSLKFRTSYGQNALLHSLEVAYLAEALAKEIGADAKICKKAGLLHDIGKAIDDPFLSHVEAGIKILQKYGIEQEVVDAVKSHHEDYKIETIEAAIVKVADQISGARPGARKDTVENYLKRLEELEKLALSFEGVEKAWALQAGREIRVFVKPEQVDDLGAEKLAREIANKIEAELKFPGEIKVVVIREKRIIEYAK